MKELELNIFKVLIGLITVNEFESIIYQEFYVEKMESNDFITDVITINYRDKNWKNKLENLIYDVWDESKYLTYVIRKYCTQIIENEDPENVFSIVNDLAQLNTEYSYEYDTLMQFFLFHNELDLITIRCNNLSMKELLIQIKAYSKLYINAYDSNEGYNTLLNLRYDKIEAVNQKEKSNTSDSIKKVSENKKWFQFWK
ncbi:hypothetical protein [Aquimarina sp. 2304DJ70-9]|uniref:hypothetical protein n=1 Tax=Aquimarina penaris TaxID=3231044 RepID=UPI0034628D74